MAVQSCMKQADVSAALEQSLLTVFDSPLSAIVDISVTSIMRSSVVESKVVAEYRSRGDILKQWKQLLKKIAETIAPKRPLD
jgi:hypothetical protein